jgi:polyisoprenoid-binding protein YceI
VTSYRGLVAATAALVVIGSDVTPASAQRGGSSAAAPVAGVRLDVAEGSRATYRVREQLAGINFPSDAVGGTNAVSGGLVIEPDGSINPAQSKLTVDLRTLKSDQDQRDGFIKGNRGLDTDKFPLAEFVVRRAVGLPWPFPAAPPAQAGFQLVGDMTIYGNTSEVTWNVIATFRDQQVAGRANTEFTFEKFKIPKPQLARLLSVDDNIKLEIELRLKGTPM